ncbi:MAG: hypothetical protein M0R38_10920 [Bacteroidia bacterium]|nr:hypothetical protein [Bacteroidia bacterium]
MSAYKKAISMFNLKGEVKEKVKQYISPAQATLRKQVGESTFREFVNLPEDLYVEGEVGFIPFEDLTESQLMRRELETAQAYFIMYYAVVGIKEFEMGNVALDRVSFGDGNLNPTGTISMERYQAIFWKMAVSACAAYTGSGDFGIIVV